MSLSYAVADLTVLPMIATIYALAAALLAVVEHHAAAQGRKHRGHGLGAAWTHSLVVTGTALQLLHAVTALAL